MKSYTVRRAVSDFTPTADFDSKEWKGVPSARIESWPWHMEKYQHPDVSAQCQYTDKFLYIRFYAKENFIIAKYTEYMGSVWLDSCVEFFVSPDNREYFNFEVNCIGTMLLCRGKDRHARIQILQSDLAGSIMATSLMKGKAISKAVKCPEQGYVVEYSIPLSLFSKYAGTPIPSKGTVWKCNFYKCGDDSPEPSWGSWSPVGTLQPDFHRPEFFGELVFG